MMKAQPSKLNEKVILGIDPGTNVMGFGIIKVRGTNIELIAMGMVQMKDSDYALKLKRIFEKTLLLVDQYHPDEFAVEAPFFGKNVQSMLKLGRAQGVAMAAALYRGIPISEYSPRKVKQSITGNGAASKEQVAGMLKNILKLDEVSKSLDATDGLAVAICHHFQSSRNGLTAGKSNWESFISKNPDRVK